MRRTGSLRATFVVFGFTIAVFLSALFGHFLLSEVNTIDKFDNGILDSGLTTLTMMDGAAVFLLLGLLAIVGMRSFRISVHPVYIVPGIIILGLMTNALAWIANMIWEIVNFGPLTASANQFPNMITLVENLHIFGLLIGGLILLLMIGRARQ